MIRVFDKYKNKLIELLSKKESYIELTENGFTLYIDDEMVNRVSWKSIKEIFAFNGDWGTSDKINIGFRINEKGDFIKIAEDIKGYDVLVKYIGENFKNIHSKWCENVAFPALETIWGEKFPYDW